MGLQKRISPAPIIFAAPPRSSDRTPHEPSTAGGRELRLEARPPARFNSLRNQQTVNQEQRPLGNTLLAQRCQLSGNSYFWHTAAGPSGRNRVSGNEVVHQGVNSTKHKQSQKPEGKFQLRRWQGQQPVKPLRRRLQGIRIGRGQRGGVGGGRDAEINPVRKGSNHRNVHS